ncbi:hypothetical protein AK812_SmicGene28221 [Symbiodinium microadriaticum]|uniref:Uncharacterized protein n=1 Tax=Symbiodinium microadriaticum TaxID=2951 RepID=A0A1Q9D4W1_SYMMI|nr:hypothetical protein AK812_SmicGene28221 [Symbiodinium microadriaticum]
MASPVELPAATYRILESEGLHQMPLEWYREDVLTHSKVEIIVGNYKAGGFVRALADAYKSNLKVRLLLAMHFLSYGPCP